MLLKIDLLTLSMGVGLKLPPFINPKCGWIGRPCPDVFKKVPPRNTHLVLIFVLDCIKIDY